MRPATRIRWIALASVFVACKGRRETGTEARPVEPAPPVRDAAVRDAGSWPGFDTLPLVSPLRTITLPSRPDQPRFDVVGPVVLGDIAVVGSSQLGFAGVDWKRGTLAWTKPAGARLAPPVVDGEDIYLIADCTGAPDVPATSIAKPTTAEAIADRPDALRCITRLPVSPAQTEPCCRSTQSGATRSGHGAAAEGPSRMPPHNCAHRTV